ncbi:unnamed protein product [Ixodes hexagonus]
MSSRRRYLLLTTFIILPLGLYLSTMMAGLPFHSLFRPMPVGSAFARISNLDGLRLRNRPNSETAKLWNPVRVLSKGHGRLPFPLETTDVLPNAHSVVLNCKRNLDYIFFVHTAPGHHQHRKVLREAMDQHSSSLAYSWTTVFFVGLSRDKDTSSIIQSEAAQHGDIALLPYQDTYKNLTYKFVYGMKWVMEYCPKVKYVVKIDDDMVTSLQRMTSYLSTVPESQTHSLHCQIIRRTPVIRDINSPWYLSEDTYPNSEFSEYCSGRGLVFRSHLLQRLYSATFCLSYHGIDDVFVTGDAALVARVGRVDISSLFSHGEDDWWKVAAGHLIFCHIPNATLRVESWGILIKGPKSLS